MSYRYKRKSRGLHYKVQTFFDISTSAESMQIINFSVGGENLKKRCAHLFLAYKYFKLGRLSVKFVPASTLPVDPLGLSYDDADPQTVDPRDQLDCGLVRITNGEDILEDLKGFTEAQLQGMYQSMLLDPRWFKFGLQSGFKRTAVPLYWQVGQLHQDLYPGATVNLGRVDGNDVDTSVMHAVGVIGQPGAADQNSAVGAIFELRESSPRGLFQVGHRGRMGFLPTDGLVEVPKYTSESDFSMIDKPYLASIPEVRVITAVLPKMRKTNYYYRCYITEEITFAGLRHYGPSVENGVNDAWYRGIDTFTAPTSVHAVGPGESVPPMVNDNPRPNNDGGGEQ